MTDLRIVPLTQTHPESKWALAWTDFKTIFIRWPFHRIFFAENRIRHEEFHVRTRIGNEGHHPWWHFCIRSAHALRFRSVHP